MCVYIKKDTLHESFIDRLKRCKYFIVPNCFATYYVCE